ncbi:unnamed protein product [Caenorhabditis auriculariae]|uniref:Uncharacterized protein n=1 Tax=Caenorhabditis auriculariae TaxID=2777116 RepID=A0A8S1HWT6_9PELO|nr:unnamed protein product [Caenorhabditis auriculariae]
MRGIGSCKVLILTEVCDSQYNFKLSVNNKDSTPSETTPGSEKRGREDAKVARHLQKPQNGPDNSLRDQLRNAAQSATNNNKNGRFRTSCFPTPLYLFSTCPNNLPELQSRKKLFVAKRLARFVLPIILQPFIKRRRDVAWQFWTSSCSL